MSKFHNVSTDARLVAYGVMSPTLVKPDEAIEVSDDVAIPGYRRADNFGNITAERPEQTFADGYRIQPTIWAEVTGPAKDKAPVTASADAPKEG